VAAHKKVTFTNPYAGSKAFLLSTDAPQLLQLHPSKLELGPGGSRAIGMTFCLQPEAAAAARAGPGGVLQRLFVFVNGEEQQGEECWQVTVKLAAAATAQAQ
jgi:nephrocystin-4